MKSILLAAAVAAAGCFAMAAPSNAAPFAKETGLTQNNPALTEVAMTRKQRMMMRKKQMMMKRNNMGNRSNTDNMNSGPMTGGGTMNNGTQMNPGPGRM